jgi:hypothetical protein
MTQMIRINKTHSNGKTATQAPATKAEKRQYKTHSNGKIATKVEKGQYKTHSNGKLPQRPKSIILATKANATKA